MITTAVAGSIAILLAWLLRSQAGCILALEISYTLLLVTVLQYFGLFDGLGLTYDLFINLKYLLLTLITLRYFKGYWVLAIGYLLASILNSSMVLGIYFVIGYDFSWNVAFLTYDQYLSFHNLYAPNMIIIMSLQLSGVVNGRFSGGSLIRTGILPVTFYNSRIHNRTFNG